MLITVLVKSKNKNLEPYSYRFDMKTKTLHCKNNYFISQIDYSKYESNVFIRKISKLEEEEMNNDWDFRII